MSKVSISQQFTQDADTLWGIVGDPAGIARWHPAIAKSPLSADGTSRVCHLEGGGEVHERITEASAAGRRYTYQIVESPLPVRDYVATLSVEPAPEGARVVWEASFEAAGAPPADVEAMIRGVFEAGLSAIAGKV